MAAGKGVVDKPGRLVVFIEEAIQESKASPDGGAGIRALQGGSKMEYMNTLTGKWVNGSFTLDIKESGYVSYNRGRLYGKGKIEFENDSFTITSTHGRKFFFFWVPFVEKVEGKYAITGDGEITVSGIEGRYSSLNGAWIKG
jgi:hypothetical protein